MTLYSNYIARQLVHATLLITISLTSIVWLMQALRFIDFIVSQGVSIWLFLKLTSLLIPSLVMMILPPAFFCAVIFTYHKLRSDSELVVMQSMGLDRWRLTQPALKVAMFFTLFAYAVALYLQPLSVSSFRELQMFLRNNYVSILLQEGVFSNPVDGLTVFIRERHDDGTLEGILVQDSRKPDNTVTMMADRGVLVQTPNGPRFLLEQGNRQEMKDGKLSFLNYDSYALDISLYTNPGRGVTRDPQELYVHELMIRDPGISNLENNKRWAELHQRLVWPGYIVTLMLVAMAFMLSGEFNRRGGWKRTTVMVLTGAALLFSSAMLRGAITKMPALYPLLYAWWLLPTLIALFVITGERFSPKMRMA